MIQQGDFDCDSTSIQAFQVSLSRDTMLLALALVDRAGGQTAAMDSIFAAVAIRGLVGGVPTSQSPEAIDWNNRIPVGCYVQGVLKRELFLDPETVVTKTTSPAFDTPLGPMVCLAGVDDAVSLEGLSPVSVTRPAGQKAEVVR